MNARLIRFTLFVLLASLTLACTPDGGSIYYIIQHEDRIVDSTLPNTITVYDVTKLGTEYFAAAGSIFRRDAASATSTWNIANPVAPPVAGALCNAIVAFGTTLWGGFVTPSGNLGLYRSDASPSFAGQPAVSDVAVKDKQVVRLKVVNANLAIVTADPAGASPPFTYQLYRTDGTTYTELVLTGHDGSKRINDVEFFSASYFATSGPKLYKGGGPLSEVTSDLGTIGATDELRDLFVDSSGTPTLYLSSKLGAVYWTADGTTWTKATAPQVSGVTPPLLALGGPVNSQILVGSDGYGYFLLPASGTAMSRFSDSTTRLFSSSIRRWLLDPGANRLFAATAGSGLWRAESPGATITWSWE